MDSIIIAKAQKILENMSLDEKIGQVTQIHYSGENFNEVAEKIEKYSVGSIILGATAFAGKNKEAVVDRNEIEAFQKISIEKTKCSIPLLFGRDVIHSHSVVFPINLALVATFDPEAVEKCYEDIREEAANDGVNWTFAPMLDFCHDPRWGRIIECQGEDPYLASKMAAAIVNGFQSDDLSKNGVLAACAKHYIGYGASEGGRDYNHTEVSDYALQNNYLPAFRSAVDSGVATVMNSFNEMNGVPVPASRKLLTDVLRGQLGFEGFVISDWGSIAQLKRHGVAADNSDAAMLALNAGIDMDMVDNCYLENLSDLIKSKKVDIKVLDKAVLRILCLKLRMGLFEHPYQPEKKLNIEKHLYDAENICAASTVLLKNKNNILPLSKSESICLTGPYINETQNHFGSWSLATEKNDVKSFYSAVKDAAPDSDITVLNSLDAQFIYPRSSNVIICMLGEPKGVTGEAESIANIEIPQQQIELLRHLKKSGKPIVGVLCYGRPVALEEAEPLFDAIIYAWHGGSRATDAISKILFGDLKPGGRLPVTFPRSTGQIPLYYNALPGARRMNGYYGEEGHITLNYNDCSGTPMYPFGYGLSYADFKYENLRVSETRLSKEDIESGKSFKITVNVRNVSKTEDCETVELYIRDKIATRVRPLRELKGFKRLSFAPFETKQVTFLLSYNELGFYLEDGTYILESGEFDVYVGRDCLAEDYITIEIA